MPTHAQLVQDIIRDPCASYWLKEAVVKLSHRDPVDVALDLAMLQEVTAARLKKS